MEKNPPALTYINLYIAIIEVPTIQKDVMRIIFLTAVACGIQKCGNGIPLCRLFKLFFSREGIKPSLKVSINFV